MYSLASNLRGGGTKASTHLNCLLRVPWVPRYKLAEEKEHGIVLPIYPRFGPSRFRVNKHRIPTFRHFQKVCQEIISVLLLAFFQVMLSVLADASCTFEVFEIASNYGSHLKDFPAVCKVESGS